MAAIEPAEARFEAARGSEASEGTILRMTS